MINVFISLASRSIYSGDYVLEVNTDPSLFLSSMFRIDSLDSFLNSPFLVPAP